MLHRMVRPVTIFLDPTVQHMPFEFEQRVRGENEYNEDKERQQHEARMAAIWISDPPWK